MSNPKAYKVAKRAQKPENVALMTGTHLRTWRIDHDLTLKDVATLLEHDVNHTSISRWETDDAGQRQIPKWATDKLLAHTQITLPLEELHQLLDLARQLQIPAQQLIARAISAYIAKQRNLLSPAAPSAEPTPAAAAIAPAPAPLYFSQPPGSTHQKVAETPPLYSTPPRKTKASFTPQKGRRLVKAHPCTPAILVKTAASTSPTRAQKSLPGDAKIVPLPPQHVVESPITPPAATDPDITATESNASRTLR